MVCEGCERRKAKLKKAWHTIEDRIATLEDKVQGAEMAAFLALVLAGAVAWSVMAERAEKERASGRA